MTWQQGSAFAVVAAMMVFFVWGRWRYDLVALCALLAAVGVGVVPAKEAFSGFSDDIVIIVASALVVSAAVARSGVIETVLKWASPYLLTTGRQVAALTAATALLSGFIKNIGTLAMLMPVAFQLGRKTETSPSQLLMPMSFSALLGGLMTLIGTSPNIIVSRSREEILGEPFGMFDFTPVGLGISIAGVLFLSLGYRLLPHGRKGTASIEAAFNLAAYSTEATVTADSLVAGKTIEDLKAIEDNEVEVPHLIRNGLDRPSPRARTKLMADDVLILAGEPAALERIVARAKLMLTRHDRAPATETAEDEIGVMEAVVTAASPLVGRSIAKSQLYARYDINILAISRRGRRLTQRLGAVRLTAGDAIVVQGNLRYLPEVLGELACLPLAERQLGLGRIRNALVPLFILGAAMSLVAAGLLTVPVAFVGAAVLMVLSGALSLREAYGAIEWPILIMLGALIPVSDALHTTGGTDLIAGWLSVAAQALPPMGALALLLVAAMAVTPFLNNAATVLIMAPIAAGLAGRLSYNPDPLLMAVAIGAGCDFLTPIGHQCNTLVMGPGGYRFSDYWKLGLPLSIIVIVVGVPLIALFWPLVKS